MEAALTYKVVDFVEQTRRLCIVIERCLDCDAYVEDEPTTISQLSPDELSFIVYDLTFNIINSCPVLSAREDGLFSYFPRTFLNFIMLVCRGRLCASPIARQGKCRRG